MNNLRLFKVNRLADIDKTKYKDGDIFYTKQSLVILLNNEIVHLVTKEDLDKVKKEGKKDEK